jgi:hypothetical protein
VQCKVVDCSIDCCSVSRLISPHCSAAKVKVKTDRSFTDITSSTNLVMLPEAVNDRLFIVLSLRLVKSMRHLRNSAFRWTRFLQQLSVQLPPTTTPGVKVPKAKSTFNDSSHCLRQNTFSLRRCHALFWHGSAHGANNTPAVCERSRLTEGVACIIASFRLGVSTYGETGCPGYSIG